MYQVFAQAIRTVISLKRAGKRPSLKAFLGSGGNTRKSMKVFEVTMNGQGSIGIVLAKTDGGFPVVTTNPDTTVQHGVCR